MGQQGAATRDAAAIEKAYTAKGLYVKDGLDAANVVKVLWQERSGSGRPGSFGAGMVTASGAGVVGGTKSF